MKGRGRVCAGVCGGRFEGVPFLLWLLPLSQLQVTPGGTVPDKRHIASLCLSNGCLSVQIVPVLVLVQILPVSTNHACHCK